jgi:lysozyme
VGGKFDDGITDEEAINLLTADVGPVERTVNDAVTFPLDQFEFDALVIFAFNVGCGAFRKSTLLKRLNSGNFLLVPYELRKWVRVNGKRCAGLANRREKEIQLWSGNI